MTNLVPFALKEAAILIACHQDGPGLERTLASIRGESPAIDVILVDDGAPEPLSRYAEDPRVMVVRLESNVGLTRALNIGLKVILDFGYRYVFRVDAGDENLPGRLQEQFQFMEEHPEVWLVGSWADFVDSLTGALLFKYQPPTALNDVNTLLNRNSCVAHPTWLARTDLFRSVGLYDESFEIAQDYEFLRRVVGKGYVVTNIPKVLLHYHVDPGSISVLKRRAQLRSRLRIQWLHRKPVATSKLLGMCVTLGLLVVPRNFVTAMKQKAGIWQ